MLARKYKERVIGFKYTAQSKSELGYGFIAVIESGRFRDCARTQEVDQQYRNCQSEILIGPSKTMRWSVPDGTRDPITKTLIHDDYITADALTAQLDLLEWYISAPTVIIETADVLVSMDRNF